MGTRTYLYSFALILYTCTPAQKIQPTANTGEKQVAKNVIFMIGDGMGLSQITAASYKKKRALEMQRFNNIGLQATHCKDDLITDSAASATAMARGVKADKNSFGSTKELKAPKSVLEIFEGRNWETGIVVTSSITHATPAAFYTYQKSRSMNEDIAVDLINADIDYLVGGGKKFFDRRVDERNLIQEWKDDGYAVKSYLDGNFSENIAFADRPYVYFTADSEPLSHSIGRDYFPEACTFGLSFLRRRGDNGFFYLIEGSQIDWAGHSNEFDWLMDELLEFDKLVGQMLDFAIKDGETLLIVTADHETGGFSILSQDPGNKKLITNFSTKLHSGANVPVFAYGPGSELFRGSYDNTEIKKKILQATGMN